MNILISVDMEGITGVTCWDDVTRTGASYGRFCQIMTTEVNAVVEGAIAAGVSSILVNDAHGGKRNLLIEELHPRAELASGSPKPLGMMCGVDSGVDLAFLIGCHAMAGTPHAVLNHTWTTRHVYALYFNGQEMGEIGLNAALAGHFGVPVAMVAGDQAAVNEAKALLGPTLHTVAVKEGYNRESTRNLSLEIAHGRLRLAAQQAIESPPPALFQFETPVTAAIEFIDSGQADRAETLPGARRTGRRRVEWVGEDIVAATQGLGAMLALA